MSQPAKIDTDARFIEYDTERKIRHRNKTYYRVLHWPIWIFVFFIAPGPLTFDLFERGFDARMGTCLGLVLLLTGIAGLRGRLPGCEPAPYIIRFTEDRPNPLYRRICYTTAWGEVGAFAFLNIAGLTYAMLTGEWRLRLDRHDEAALLEWQELRAAAAGALGENQERVALPDRLGRLVD